MRIVERVEGHYETEDVEFGKIYRWCPESVVVECECGKSLMYTRSALIGSVVTCECGKDHTARIRGDLVIQMLKEDETVHPWRYWRSSEESGIPF